ncbi:manganese efflux pump [Fonticella tunisiensis]|uniref:manganese efflux pump n=1 Tax=Fonticella tunisiensis TaxID=1096341 RepID=UPI0014152C67|nr:manganese efflux pump [Fonticella tunisiensis]
MSFHIAKTYSIIDFKTGVILVDFLNLILVAIAVSIDGFWGGFAFGLRKIKITPISLIIISSWSVLCTLIAMVIGYNLKNIISIKAAKYIGAALLFLLGLFTFISEYKESRNRSNINNGNIKFKIKDLIKVLGDPILADFDKKNDIKPIEGSILGLAVAMDASIAAFTLSLMGFNPFITPFLFGLTHFILIGLGNILARQNLIKTIGEKISILPGMILIILALLRLV